MADIYQITTPNGTTYNLKDKWARDEIAAIQSAIAGGVTFMGQTTTELTDGATTSTIVINGNNVTASKGYLVVTQQYNVEAETTAYQTIPITYVAGQTISYYTGTAVENSAVTLTGQETATVTESGGWIIPNAPDTYYDYYNGNIPCKVVREVDTQFGGSWTLKYYRLSVHQLSGYGKEFVYDGTKWIELGDLNALGDLAWVDMASADYTPAGTVSQPTFTGNEMTSTSTFALKSYSLSSANSQNSQGTYVQVASGVSSKSFTGTAATITSTVTPAGTVAISTGSGTANYTPAGTVSAPAITKTAAGTTTTVNSITAVGTLPTLTTSVANENLTISFDQGTLPTKGANTTVKTGDATYSVEAPTFTGTGVDLEATFTGTQVEGTASYTPAGTLSVGLSSKYLYLTNSDYTKTITATGTPTGTVSQPTFSGTQATITVAPST